MRAEYNQYNTLQAYSALVRDIPKTMRDDDSVVHYFSGLYPQCAIQYVRQ